MSSILCFKLLLAIVLPDSATVFRLSTFFTSRRHEAQSDGALMFLQHIISKMEGASTSSTHLNNIGIRIAIIFNGSPQFTGDAGSGESDIRKWIIENDWLEAILALPTEMCYNTGIATYVWIVTNNKKKSRKGKAQLINAVDFWKQMRKSLGNKRRDIDDDQIRKITGIYTGFKEGEFCKIFDNEYFGYTKVTVERPLVENGKGEKGKTHAVNSNKVDSSLRDYEKIPLKDDIDAYFKKEVLPHVPDA